ncbi:MAG: Gfo/Idh/MocA family protein [Pirellulaceae bacterium]
MELSSEQREIGRENYYSAVTAMDQIQRRDFLKATIAGGAAAAGLGAIYFGYHRPNRPVRIAVIGTGDEGNVLIGALNPDYVELAAICDIRPSSIHRAFHGDWASPNALKARPGMLNVYGWPTEDAARKHVTVTTDYRDVLRDKSIEGVIIALPLHLHAQVAIEAMAAGKHVLVEKLMAHNIAQCKLMARMARREKRQLSVGHQRHYNILYDNAINMIQWGLLGEIHHIRAQWHRNNLPGADSWALPIPGGEFNRDGMRVDKIREQLDKMVKALPRATPADSRLLRHKIAQWQSWDNDKTVDAARHGYIDNENVYPDGRVRSALEELVRWRLWDRTGGGLMAELGSHQLDAASIFISALSRKVGHHVHPMTVHAVGGRHLFPGDRDADDHVYCMLEYPGQGYDYDFEVGYYDKINQVPSPTHPVPGYGEDRNKKIVVTYSSINGNNFGGYGEWVMGTRATLYLDGEKEAMLYPNGNSSMKVGVKGDAGAAVLDTSASGDPAPAQAAESAAGNVSRGYREEIEHWAWCIRQNDPGVKPRCDSQIALADAVVALSTRLAIQKSKLPRQHGFMQFNPDWFDIDNDAVPETQGPEKNPPTIASETRSLQT